MFFLKLRNFLFFLMYLQLIKWSSVNLDFLKCTYHWIIHTNESLRKYSANRKIIFEKISSRYFIIGHANIRNEK